MEAQWGCCFTRSCRLAPLFFISVLRMTLEAREQLDWESTSPSNSMKSSVLSCCWGRRLLMICHRTGETHTSHTPLIQSNTQSSK